jgi:hypothetical protein
MRTTKLVSILSTLALVGGCLVTAVTRVEAQEQAGRFGVGVAAGIVAPDNFESVEFGGQIAPRFVIVGKNCWVIDPPPPECDRPWISRIRLPIIVKPFVEPAPWQGLVPGFTIPVRDLEVGPAIFVTPEVDLTFQPTKQVRPVVFVGGGFVWEGGQETDIAGIGTFETDDNLAPVVTFGAGLDVSVTRRVSLMLEARAYVVFMGEMNITTPSGGVVTSGDTILTEALFGGIIVDS